MCLQVKRTVTESGGNIIADVYVSSGDAADSSQQ